LPGSLPGSLFRTHHTPTESDPLSPPAQAVQPGRGHPERERPLPRPWPRTQRKPPPEAKAAYDALIAEWIANGRRLPDVQPEPLSVTELIVAYLTRHVAIHYSRSDGTSTTEVNEYRLALRPVRDLLGRVPANEFSPLKLKAVREQMIAAGLARSTINHRVDRIKRTFKWAVAEELVPETTFRALTTVTGLKHGRTETAPVRPVAAADVEATLPHLSRIVGVMVRVQMLTGMRSGERCAMRTTDIDRSGPVWLYRPPAHKTSHHGLARVIAIGPRAQEVLTEAPTLHWHPHQLRHTHGTEIRRQFGLEAAQVVLGHTSAQVTQIYAERDQAQAVDVAAKIG
jgi:integrase